jgi:hypothetical protein
MSAGRRSCNADHDNVAALGSRRLNELLAAFPYSLDCGLSPHLQGALRVERSEAMISRQAATRGTLQRLSAPAALAPLLMARNIAGHVACSALGLLQPRRRRLGVDPIQSGQAQSRYVPVPIDRLKISGAIDELILARRNLAPGLEIASSARLAVIIPYRDRAEQLSALLARLRATLAQQAIDYRLIVVEQSDKGLFNRGTIKNVGAVLAADWADYFCFHDVDNLPETANYGMPSQPMRLVKAYSKTHRKDNPIRGYFFGAVVSISREQFQLVNGYNNQYWGWGQEDEDFFLRCLLSGLTPYEDSEGVFHELDNPSQELTERSLLIRRRNRYLMKSAMTRLAIGQSGLSDLRYKVASKSQVGRTVHVLADI